MPLPLFLGIAAAVAAAGGIGTGVHGAVKMKGANDTVKSAGERHNKNIQRFESCNSRTAGSMDALGKLELDILASFQQFSDMFEQIQNRPSFKEFACDSVDLPSLRQRRNFRGFRWRRRSDGRYWWCGTWNRRRIRRCWRNNRCRHGIRHRINRHRDCILIWRSSH